MGLGAAGTAAAIGVAGSAASAGGSILSSSNNASAAKQAASEQSASSAAALNQQAQQFAYSQGQELPYIQNGDNAQTVQNNLIGTYGSTVTPYFNQLANLGNGATAQQTLAQTPGYQFALNQGLAATSNAAAARGLGVSGAALKGAATFSTGLADNTYQQQYSDASNNLTQAQNTFSGLNNALAGEATLGGNVSVSAGTQAQNATTNTSNLLTGQGNSNAASTLAGANALAAGTTGVTNSLTGALANPAVTNYLAGLAGNGSQYNNSNGGDGAPQTAASGYGSFQTS